MNHDNTRAAITEELKRAKEALCAADLLFENKFITDAVSKLYYYLLYNIRALLLTKNLEPRSHEGVLRLFGLHFVKPGIFTPNASHVLSKMMKFREEADYNPSYMFTGDDYTEFRSEVSSVSEDVREYLNEAGFINKL